MDKIDKDSAVAVVGASNDRGKYGNKVFEFLKSEGYDAVPINLDEDEIEGVKCFQSLTDCLAQGKTIDAVVTIVPPDQTEKIVKECAVLGIRRIWMQPGSESASAIRLCSELGIDVVTACMMTDSR